MRGPTVFATVLLAALAVSVFFFPWLSTPLPLGLDAEHQIGVPLWAVFGLLIVAVWGFARDSGTRRKPK